MKRRQFIREIEAAGCVLRRHGATHDIYLNPANGKTAPGPRHQELADSLAGMIRKQLGLM